MKKLYLIITLSLLCICNLNAQKISTKLFGEKFNAVKSQKQTKSRVNSNQFSPTKEVSQGIFSQARAEAQPTERMTKLEEYVETPTTPKKLERVISYEYDNMNRPKQRFTKYKSIIPGATNPNSKDSKETIEFTPQDGNQIQQTTIYYERPALTDNPWEEISQLTVTLDNKGRMLEQSSSTERIVATYDDENNKDEAITYKKNGDIETPYKKTIQERFNVKQGIVNRQIDYLYRNAKWENAGQYERELTYDGHTIIAYYSWDNGSSKWVGTKKETKQYDDEGRLLYSLSFYWNADNGIWILDNEEAYAYDNTGRLIMEQEGGYESDAKYEYSDYCQLFPGEYTPKKQKTYVRDSYGSPWELLSDATIETNEYNQPIKISIASNLGGTMKEIIRSDYTLINANSYSLITSERSEDDSWNKTERITITTDTQHRIVGMTTEENTASAGEAVWKKNEVSTYTYEPDNKITEIREGEDDRGNTIYEKLNYTLYSTGEMQSATHFISRTGTEDSWSENSTTYYKKNGEVDYYVYNVETFQTMLDVLQNISWTIPTDVKKIKCTKSWLDENGDGLFDRDNGTYITFVKNNNEELLVFALDRKYNSQNALIYNIDRFLPELTGGSYGHYEEKHNYDHSDKETGYEYFYYTGPQSGYTRYGVFTYEQVPTGVKDASEDKDNSSIQVYSSSDKLYIHSAENMHIGIFTVDGKKVRDITINEGTTEIALPKGFYLVRSLNDARLKGAKVIIE